jgi:hypothetical protein
MKPPQIFLKVKFSQIGGLQKKILINIYVLTQKFNVMPQMSEKLPKKIDFSARLLMLII